MDQHFNIGEMLKTALDNLKVGVLATVGDRQPHTSLVALTPFDGIRQLIFATYRNTRKYNNLNDNNGVSIFIDNRHTQLQEASAGFVITATGKAKEISHHENQLAKHAHLERHPEFSLFINSEKCALFRVSIDAYQIVTGIADAKWYTIDHLGSE